MVFLKILYRWLKMVVESVDVSAIGYMSPIFVFLVLAIVIFAVLRKSGILGGHVLLEVIVSLCIPGIFVTVPSLLNLILIIIPWFVVLVFVLFAILFLTSFVGGGGNMAGKGLALIFVIILGIVVIVAAINVFSGSIFTYLPGPMYGVGVDKPANPQTMYFFNWFYSAPVFGALLLIIAAIVVSWILLKVS